MTRKCLFRVEHGQVTVLWVPAADYDDSYQLPEHMVAAPVRAHIDQPDHWLAPWTKG